MENTYFGLKQKVLPLKEAEKAFLKAKEKEIKRRAKELFNSMKAEWEKSEKLREVSNEAVKLLKHIVEVLSKPGPQFFPEKVVEIGIPEKVEEILNREVERRIRVKVEPKVKELEEKTMTNAFTLLKGPWTITCDKCHLKQSIEFTPQGIEELLRNRFIAVECENPDCRNLFGRHKIRVELKGLIS